MTRRSKRRKTISGINENILAEIFTDILVGDPKKRRRVINKSIAKVKKKSKMYTKIKGKKYLDESL